jgi:chromate transporter
VPEKQQEPGEQREARKTGQKQPAQTGSPQPRVSALALFITFFRIGLFTLGGGLAMMGVMRHELVMRRKWLSEDKFINNVSLATSVPGAIAVNLAYLLGKQLAGWQGVLAAVSGVVLPSFTAILLVVMFLFDYFKLPIVTHFFTGAAAAVTALIVFSAYLYGRRIIFDLYSLLVTIVFFALLFLFNLHPLLVILFATLIRYFLPQKKEKPVT